MQKFEIITNSQSRTGYDIPDSHYMGQLPDLLRGWQFEFSRNGEIRYGSLKWYHGTAEECATEYERKYGVDTFEREHLNGWRETGRVVFRGYASEYYDAYEREWFVEHVDEQKVREILTTPA